MTLSTRKPNVWLPLMVAAISIASPLAGAQGIITGSLTGTIEDATGAVVPGATVVVRNTARGVEVKTTSTDSGSFLVSDVPIGDCTITITLAGFSELKIAHVQIEAGKSTGIGAEKLQTGGASETVEVTSAQNLLETVQSQVSTTFDAQQVQNLPTGGGFDELALLIPGVVSTRGDNFSNTNGAGISSNGQRGRNNNFEIDGQSNNDNSVAGPQVFFQNQDAI